VPPIQFFFIFFFYVFNIFIFFLLKIDTCPILSGSNVATTQTLLNCKRKLTVGSKLSFLSTTESLNLFWYHMERFVN
jgi:hypothetical protein